jgi:hypothetical protein
MKTPPLLSEAAEFYFGQKITQQLTLSSGALPHDITARLRVARMNAVQVVRQQRQQLAGSKTSVQGDTGVLSGESLGWWGRFATLIPAVLLALGLLVIAGAHDQTRVLESARVDLALLTDDLPPSAYSDPGFIRFVTLQSLLNP